MASTVKTTAATRLKSSMPALLQPTAELWNTIFNVVLVVGAILVLTGTWGAFWTGNMKEFYSNERISANEAQTAAANAAAAQAGEGAARANERAALADERTTALRSDVERARVEQERLRAHAAELELQLQRQGPRTLSNDQLKRISASIKSDGIRDVITFDYYSETETHNFTKIIAGAMQLGGANVEAGAAYINAIENGIVVWDQSGSVQRALMAANINYKDATGTGDKTGIVVQIGPKDM
ncbi:hypothetical protein [Methylobacterium sp. OT2]|uniref:hypothetical protein n=1 Tax=Methylobacterium sp. OT2 TaxID=2813779 RepID=UPI00197B540B|nr:hypothetical protein [Methylobacterium sp. OT2]MBN4095665.1 hypothetical protein [Methylobacterium sp. OT2]